MSRQAPVSVELRAVQPEDLTVFFEHESEPEAAVLAAYPARDRATFMRYWNELLDDRSVLARTILAEGRIAGNIRSFDYDGKREIGYWLGREFWGQGIATRALAVFLRRETTRPLYGYVALHNPGSRRVLEKCGFRVIGEDAAFTQVDGVDVAGYVLELTVAAPAA